MKRFLWLGLVLFVSVIETGCGNPFRPIILPTPPVFPNPQAAHSVLSFNDNGAFVSGSAMVVDVSGDTVVSIADTGIHPVHAAQQTANQVLVVNQAVTAASIGNVPTTICLVTPPALPPPAPPPPTFDVCPSVSKLGFGTTISSNVTITLPIYSGSNFVAVAPSAASAYVTMPTSPPDPTQPQTILPSVGVVNTLSNSLVTTIPVGSNPY